MGVVKKGKVMNSGEQGSQKLGQQNDDQGKVQRFEKGLRGISEAQWKEANGCMEGSPAFQGAGRVRLPRLQDVGVQADSSCQGFRMLRQEYQQQHKGLEQTAKLHVFSETPGKESATVTVEDVALLRFQMS